MLDVDWIKKIQVLRFPAGAAVAALMQAGTVSYGIYGKAEWTLETEFERLKS